MTFDDPTDGYHVHVEIVQHAQVELVSFRADQFVRTLTGELGESLLAFLGQWDVIVTSHLVFQRFFLLELFFSQGETHHFLESLDVVLIYQLWIRQRPCDALGNTELIDIQVDSLGDDGSGGVIQSPSEHLTTIPPGFSFHSMLERTRCGYVGLYRFINTIHRFLGASIRIHVVFDARL